MCCWQGSAKVAAAVVEGRGREISETCPSPQEAVREVQNEGEGEREKQQKERRRKRLCFVAQTAGGRSVGFWGWKRAQATTGERRLTYSWSTWDIRQA